MEYKTLSAYELIEAWERSKAGESESVDDDSWLTKYETVGDVPAELLPRW